MTSVARSASRPLSIRRVVWIGAGVLALVITAIAFTQKPRFDGSRHLLGPLDWLLHPIQNNSFAYEPMVTENIRSVDALEGTLLVWAVGGANLIVRSTNGGATWEQATVDTTPASAAGDPGEQARQQAAQRELGLLGDSIRQVQNRIAALDQQARDYLAKVQQANVQQYAQDPKQAQKKATVDPFIANLQRERSTLVTQLNRLQATQKSLAPTQQSVHQVTPAVVNLNDVQFIDAAHGFVVGDHGLILTSADSGRTWQRLPSVRAERLAFVHFSDQRRGWMAAPEDRTTFFTADGGQNWTRTTQSNDVPLYSAGALGDSLMWVEADSTSANVSRDYGQTWKTDSVPFRLSGKLSIRGLGVDYAAFSDQSTSQKAPRALLDRLDAFGGSGLPAGDSGVARFVNEHTGWYAEGALYHTTNRGQQWLPVISRRKLNDIHFFDARHGWAASQAGVLLRTRDGGKTWKTVQTGTIDEFRTISFLNERLGCARTEKDNYLTTNGRSWSEADAGSPAPLCEQSLTVAGDSVAVALGDGALLRFRRVGGSWLVVDTVGTTRFRSVSFRDLRNGIGIDEHGYLITTADSGRTWVARPTYARDNIAASMVGQDSSLVLDAGGSLRFYTPNDPSGTEVLSELTPARVYVAPWYYAAMVTLVILAMLLSRIGGDVHTAVEAIFAPDRPLEPEDRDDLGVRPIARAVSSFLRNNRTRPPLTLAITGKWGSGKSSLLNLIQADLRKFGLRPVWFNAWHHQKEDNLLAALLDTVRKDAVPPIWTLSGILFNTRLIFIRLRRYWLLLIALIAPAYFLGPRLFANNGTALSLPAALGALTDALTRFAQRSGRLAALADLGKSLTILAGPLLAAATVYSKVLKAFGVNPATLLSAKSGTGSIRDLSAQTGFRHQFAREFREVTRALGRYRLVIIVDDLDRCRPANVLDVLEAINFLVSSGDCFILLGIDRDQVVSYVGMAFKDAAAELAAQSKEKNSEFANKSEAGVRAWYAQEYLEKLINLDIPVPIATADRVRDVLAPDPAIPIQTRRRIDWRKAVKPTRAKAIAASIMLVLSLSSFFAVRWRASAVQQSAASDSTAVATAPAAAPTPAPSTPAADTTNAPVPITVDPLLSEARLVDPHVIDQRKGVTSIGLALALIGLIWFFLRQPDPVVRDSNDFLFGLRASGAIIYDKRRTPRAAKKFLNRVRYYAMRQRPAEDEVRIIDTMAAWIKQRFAALKTSQTGEAVELARNAPASDEPIPEKLLVALSALYDSHPDWLTDPQSGLWSGPESFLKSNGYPPSSIVDLAMILEGTEGLQRYRKDFLELVSDTR